MRKYSIAMSRQPTGTAAYNQATEISMTLKETLKWLEEDRVIDAGSPPTWQSLRYDLKDLAGKTVGIVIRVSYGGPKGVMNEEAFFDEISVKAE